jgi:hypothetical protein
VSNQDRARYRRNKTIKYKRSQLRLGNRIPAGTLIEFQYGVKKKLDESGGWKGDPRPILLVFYDDQDEYIEGINTNYLNAGFLREFIDVLHKAPGVGKSPNDGKLLYKLMKSVEPDLLKAYRKYKRNVILTAWKLEVDLSIEKLKL